MGRSKRQILRSERVFLCHPAIEDQADFVSAMKRSRKLHASFVRAPETPAQFRAYLEKATGDRNESVLICQRTDDALVGVINLNEIVGGAFKSTYLGYYGTPEHSGQGLMTEGLDLTLRFAFRKIGLHRAEANIQPENTASIKLVKRVGFQKEGYSPRYLKIAGAWRDHERWAILRDDWEKRC